MVAEARRAEVDGFASYWAPQIFGHDALTALAVIGREVPRIELGTSVVPTYPRHPMMMAQQALTVNAAAGGRLCLGIGLSHQIVVESMWGMSFDKPVRHMREYLEVMMPLLEGKPVSHAGEAFNVNGGINVPGYAASKGAVIALSREIAVQWARKGVRVNSLCPGWFVSEMTAGMDTDDSSQKYVMQNSPIP